MQCSGSRNESGGAPAACVPAIRNERLPALVRGEGERDAVHRDAIERGLVECCNDALAQDRPDELGQRQRSRGQRRRVSADQGFGFGR